MPRTPTPFQASTPAEPVETVVAEPTVKTPVSGEPAAVTQTPVDIDAAWNALEEPVRSGIAERLHGAYNAALEEQYGDIIPVIREAATNQNWRNVLKEFASDAEIRNFVADGGTLEQIRMLQKDPSLREFFFKDAYEAYQKYPQTPAVAADPMEPLATRISTLEQQLTQRDQEEAFGGYVSSRKSEIEALRSAAPTLKENEALLKHVVEYAEHQFKVAAASRGIDVKFDEKHGDKIWSAQAVRAGIRPPSYLDVYRQYEQLTGKTPPPAAPIGKTSARSGRSVQAPRTRVEGASLSAQERREQAIAQMKKRNLAAVKG